MSRSMENLERYNPSKYLKRGGRSGLLGKVIGVALYDSEKELFFIFSGQ